MNQYSRIADGLSAWLAFEARCGRDPLFSESYLAHPLGQLLRQAYQKPVRAEHEHPVLAAGREHVRGRRPSIDFVVMDKGDKIHAAVEVKWLSDSSDSLRDILRDIVRDLVRLDLLLPDHANEALLLVAGTARQFRALGQLKSFQAHPSQPNSHPLLPLEPHQALSVRFYPVPGFRRSFFKRVLADFRGSDVSHSIPIGRCGPWPKNARDRDCQVVAWVLRGSDQRPRFKPEDVYPGLW